MDMLHHVKWYRTLTNCIHFTCVYRWYHVVKAAIKRSNQSTLLIKVSSQASLCCFQQRMLSMSSWLLFTHYKWHASSSGEKHMRKNEGFKRNKFWPKCYVLTEWTRLVQRLMFKEQNIRRHWFTINAIYVTKIWRKKPLVTLSSWHSHVEGIVFTLDCMSVCELKKHLRVNISSWIFGSKYDRMMDKDMCCCCCSCTGLQPIGCPIELLLLSINLSNSW